MWWLYLIVAVVFVLAVWSFVSLMGFQTRWLSRKSTRRTEDLYADYADRPPPRRHS